MLINPSEAHEQEQRAFLKGLADKGQQEADRVLQSISGLVSNISQSIQDNMVTVLDPNERARKLDKLLGQIETIQKSISKFSKNGSPEAPAKSNAKAAG